MFYLLALMLPALWLPGAVVAQTATMPALTPENMQAITNVLQSPAMQGIIASQLGQATATQAAAPATPAGLSGMGVNIGAMSTVLQNFTPAEIAAMQRFALSPEGQSIAQKIPAVIQQLQAQGQLPAAGQ